eukprot:CAMPEP_0118942794 /NCGR_PEP_ID=MMETSP1169-20130426/36854_1 /TAXON_ID=36882 /ORGANISM="Pyramimonas obovata, Strain CCMP722" /LENGTH=97 /DNA_ID=CAMNT_0006887871 /DNA_START=208 /DNA_END=497 /DNA_ORIENTATION=+
MEREANCCRASTARLNHPVPRPSRFRGTLRSKAPPLGERFALPHSSGPNGLNHQPRTSQLHPEIHLKAIVSWHLAYSHSAPPSTYVMRAPMRAPIYS